VSKAIIVGIKSSNNYRFDVELGVSTLALYKASMGDLQPLPTKPLIPNFDPIKHAIPHISTLNILHIF
jgi:hypothetical protein